MATTTTPAQLIALTLASQSFVPESEAQRQSTFLSLAPTLSTTYPANPAVAAKTTSPAATDSAPAVSAADVVPIELKSRRSSSLSSDGSGSAPKGQRRFLKLGPVHHGENGGGDWSEDVIAE